MSAARVRLGVLKLLRMRRKSDSVKLSLEVSEKAVGTPSPECDRGKNRKCVSSINALRSRPARSVGSWQEGLVNVAKGRVMALDGILGNSFALKGFRHFPGCHMASGILGNLKKAWG